MTTRIFRLRQKTLDILPELLDIVHHLENRHDINHIVFRKAFETCFQGTLRTRHPSETVGTYLQAALEPQPVGETT